MSSTAINSRELESLFARELGRITIRATESLHQQIQKADDLERRRVFEGGLRDWAESLVHCSVDFVPRFRALARQRHSVGYQDIAEGQIWQKLIDFLGVDFTKQPEEWPDSNRIEIFTRSVCFCGASLPAWFEVGFLLAATLSHRPPKFMGEQVSRQRMCEVYQEFSKTLINELIDRQTLVSMDLSILVKQTKAEMARRKISIPKTREDLSDILRPEELTPRQLEVMSLRWERKMTVTAIAAYYGVDRSTIQGHLRAANRRLQHARQNQATKKRAVGRISSERTG